MSEELDQQFEEQFQEDAAPPAGETEEPSSTVPAPEEAPVVPETVRIGDRDVPASQADSAVRFLDWAAEHPDDFDKIVRWERGELDFVPKGQPQRTTPEEPEEEIDYYSEDFLKSLKARQDAFEAQITAQAQVEKEAIMNEGIQRFLGAHQDLTPEDTEKVFQWVHQRNTLSSIPADVSSVQAINEIAERFEESYRVLNFDRSKNEATKQVVQDMKSRRRASSASSSAASTPRGNTTPQTPEERRQYAIDAIANDLANR